MMTKEGAAKDILSRKMADYRTSGQADMLNSGRNRFVAEEKERDGGHQID